MTTEDEVAKSKLDKEEDPKDRVDHNDCPVCRAQLQY